jgi:hypothetical protein
MERELPNEAHELLGHWSHALALALILLNAGCEPVDHTEPGDEATGSLALALASTTDGNEYRFIGAVHVLSSAGEIAASIDATAASPATHDVALLAGEYTVAVPEGYSCGHVGTASNFSGCSFIRAVPQPFTVSGGATAFVQLEVAFHFALEQDVIVVFGAGSAELSLSPRDQLVPRCGNGAGCTEANMCLAIDGAVPRCHAPCGTDADCRGRSECILVEPDPSSGSSVPFRVCLAPVVAGEDITAPVFLAASVTPLEIDTTEGEAVVDVQMEVSDDLSGISQVQARFSSASGQFRHCTVFPENPGTSASLSCSAQFPAFGEGGEWSVSFFVADAVGSQRFVSSEELSALGLPSVLHVN